MALTPEEELLTQDQVDPYRETIEGLARRENGRLRQSLQVASSKTPDRQAEVLTLSERMGLPAPFVDRNFDELKKRSVAAGWDLEKMRRETPKTAEFLSNPDNAGISQDDHEQLGALENIFHYAGNAVRSVGASFSSTNAALWGLFQAPADVVADYFTTPLLGAADPIAKLSATFRKYQREQEQVAAGVRPKASGILEQGVYQGLESLGQNLLLLPAAALSGGSAESVLLAGMGATTGGQAYGQAKQQGVNTLRALNLGLSQGLIEVATEKIPVATLFKGLKDNAGFVQLMAKSLAAELPGEQVATILQDLNEWSVLPENATKSFGDYLRERPSAAASTAIATIVGTVGQVGMTRVIDRAFLKSAGEAAKNSKTGQRMPEKLEQFIAAAAKDGIENVYVSPEDIKTYAQSGKLDPEAFVDSIMPGGREAFQSAVATGQDLEIPVQYYVTKVQNSDAGAFFEPLARIGSPERMNAKETEQLAQGVTEESKDVNDTFTSDQNASAVEVREDIVGQLQGLGFTPETVDAYAQLYASAFQTMGQRAGVDPFSLYEPYRLKIARPLPEILTRKGNVDTQLDPLIDRLRAGMAPSQAEMFGASLLEFLKNKGGLRDENGELQNLEPDADRRAFTKNLIQEKGIPLDTARELAAEAGYLDSQSSIADFLDVIEKEVRGAPVFAAAQHNAPAIEQKMMLEQLDSYLKSRDVDLKAATNEDIKKLLQDAVNTPEIDPATGTVLNQGGMEQANRANIRFGKSRQFTIELLEKADLSSFLHESSHFYLEVFGDLIDELRTKPGDLGPMQQQMVADFEALLKYTGYHTREQMQSMQAEAAALAGKIAREGRDPSEAESARLSALSEPHEIFARSFEGYLREGKAPAPALRRIFARFRAWLVNIYRSLTQLNVQLTPEVTAIFDRMLASDEQIEQARQESQILAMIENQGQAERLGLTADQYRVYADTVRQARDRQQEKLFSEYLEEYNRHSSEWYQARRSEVRDEVAREVQGQRDYIALAFLKAGTLPDGYPLPEGVAAMKLDADVLEERYGRFKDSSIMKQLRKLDVYRREGGVNPDTVAELFGYSSGDELVQALVNSRPMDQLIDAETDDRMKQSYGDILTDGTAPEKAKEAVMTVGRSEVIEAEMKALAGKIREVAPFVNLALKQERQANRQARAAGIDEVKRFIPSVALARSVAEGRIAAMRVRDIRPGVYYAAARRESMRALEAVNKENYSQALEAKQKELINVELYRAATAAQKEVGKLRDYMRSFDETKKRGRIGKAGEDYLDQIDALRDRFDFARITQKQIDRRKSLLEWVASQQAKGLPVELPSELLNEARRVNYQDAPLEELRGLRDGVQMIEHLAILKNKLLKAKAKRELDAAVNDMVTSIDGNAKGPREKKFEVRLPQDRLARTVSQWFAAHRKLSSFLRELDGWKDGGQMWESIMRPINEAANEEALENEKATRELAGIFDSAFAGEESTLYRKMYLPALNTSLSRMARLMIALNWGNEGNRQRVRGGFGWTDAQVGAVLDTLTEKDWKFVKDVWKFVNSYWPAISDKQQRVTGVRPDKVETSAFRTRFGEVPGGYFPIKYEGQLSARASSNLEGDFADSIKQASYARATTQRGHTEARLENVEEPVRLDFGVITEHTQQVIHDLTHHEMLIDVGRLLSNRKVQDSIFGFYGNDVAYENMKGVIHDVAWGNQPAAGWWKPIAALRQGQVTASLGWNVVTSILQPFQVSNAMVRVGPKWIARGFIRWTRNAASMESTAQWIQERSEFMRTRGQTQLREINEIRNKVGLDRGRVSGWIHDSLHKMGIDASHMPAIADSYFYLIQKAQQVADIPTWLGAYEKAMAGGETEDRAVDLADQAVIDAQGSGHIKDLAAVERQPFFKIFTTFYSYNNLLLNQSYEVIRKNEGFGRKLVDASLLLFVPSAIAFFIHGITGGFDDDKDMAEQLIRQEIADLFGMFTLLREVSGPLQGYDYQGPAGVRGLVSLAKAGKQIGQGELDPAFWESVVQAGGVLFNKPAVQVQRTAEGIEALWEGKTRNPSVLLFGPPRQ